ncbi:MAG: class I tRNA ligase family protein, partial [archaeon]|nr:class I tRNA ligase family protein [archaeon]
LSEFQHVLTKVSKAWNELDIYTATQTLKGFGTGILPSHYLEMVKSRLYDDDAIAAWTIHRIVRDFMTLFSPICPFFAHHISLVLYGQSAVECDSIPQLQVKSFIEDPTRAAKLRALSNQIQEFNGMVWNAKKESGLSLNQPIQSIFIPNELAAFTSTLVRMHNLE